MVTSFWENANPVKGWNTTKFQYKHVMYNFLTEVASHSPFMFAKTATANREVTGEVVTVGQLKYNLVNLYYNIFCFLKAGYVCL